MRVVMFLCVYLNEKPETCFTVFQSECKLCSNFSSFMLYLCDEYMLHSRYKLRFTIFMKKIFLLAIFSLLAVTGAFAQSRETLKRTFDAGRFLEAKPMAEKLYAKYPKNSEYNYWYAACCIETGDTVDVEPMLQFAASRKIVNAFRYLGDWYYGKQYYSAAAEQYSEFIDKTKDNELRDAVQKRLNLCDRLDRMVRNSEVVCFIDSIVVDKEAFLSVYRMGNDAGIIATCAQYFADDELRGHINETERGMDIFFSDENEDSVPLLKLFHRSKVGEEWGKVQQLQGIETYGNDDYPFLLADGVTLYFASDGHGSIGGYDIFVSRMDTENDRFYRPDNVGMPFNSTSNDYMMAINEVANLGWFATDRNQPEGKVCVYVFVPNSDKERVDVDVIGYDNALAVANISSIADTQRDEDVVRDAQRQMTMLIYAQDAARKSGDFFFVIDDLNDYRSLSDFKSSAARELFKEWQSGVKEHESDIRLLDSRRDEYASATAAGKAKMRDTILELESKIESDARALKLKEYEVRRLEQEEMYGK